MTNGGWYLGSFHKGQFSGKGHLFEGDNFNNYEGEFLEGKKHGIGVTSDTKNKKEKALWNMGKKVQVVQDSTALETITERELITESSQDRGEI